MQCPVLFLTSISPAISQPSFVGWLYDKLVSNLERIVKIANEFKEEKLIKNLTELTNQAIKAFKLAIELSNLGKIIKDSIKKI